MHHNICISYGDSSQESLLRGCRIVMENDNVQCK